MDNVAARVLKLEQDNASLVARLERHAAVALKQAEETRVLNDRLDRLCWSVDLKAQLTYSQSELNDARADRASALAARLDALKSETAEWIDQLQAEDARQAACCGALEVANAGCELAFCEVVEERNLLTERLRRLAKWIDGTDLATSTRFCALSERVAALEREAEEDVSLLEIIMKQHSVYLPDLSLRARQIVVDDEWVIELCYTGG